MPYSDEYLKDQLPNLYGQKPYYRLRWRFDFMGRKSRYSGWNDNRQDPKSMAAFVNKTGLVRAAIEGERVGQWSIKTLLEMDGHVYASAEWVNALTSPAFFGSGSFRAAGTPIGLSFLTADKKYTVYVDGQIKVRNLNNYEQKFKLTEHRLGV
jgi:hypothetical protein